jgi:molecular chaperone GrpE
MSKPGSAAGSHVKNETAKGAEEKAPNRNEPVSEPKEQPPAKEVIDANDKKDKLFAEIEDLKKQLEKSKSDHLYLLAEFDTYRRNAIKERCELQKFSCVGLVNDLLSVIDNFERALETKLTPETIENYHKGVEMTAAELKNVLKKHGVSEVPTQGKPFDPAVHEAVGAEETDKLPPGHVTQVFKKPYKHHDKVIRTGQVVVAKEKS